MVMSKIKLDVEVERNKCMTKRLPSVYGTQIESDKKDRIPTRNEKPIRDTTTTR